ncbi:MAG: alpha/beta hydrolase [Desulfobacteraceae bacterium]|jgi:pimeloyl-ACP methyl ester carboxylesterase|nr:alpha/beta hydrolase [Desulfobacteraceae bacterium]
MFWIVVVVLAGGYLVATLVLTYLVHRLPRRPVVDRPDWGETLDTWVPARGGGRLELWRIVPPVPVRGTLVMIHGWSRNRDRMVARARHFARQGMITVLFSARDHGRSSRFRFMNAAEFAEDALAVMDWLGHPVILYGHSAGAGGAIIAASRRPEQVALLFLESCYADSREGLLSLYRWFNPFFGRVFGPMILNWMNLMYRFRMKDVSPERLAPRLPMPAMVIHGAGDRRFPAAFARRLHRAFPEGRARLLVVPGAGHSESSAHPQYPAAVADFLAAHPEACAATIPPPNRTWP